jgi:hypothetical protein
MIGRPTCITLEDSGFWALSCLGILWGPSRLPAPKPRLPTPPRWREGTRFPDMTVRGGPDPHRIRAAGSRTGARPQDRPA